MSKFSDYVNERIAAKRQHQAARIFGTPEPDAPTAEQNIIDRLFPNRETNTEGDTE